MPRRTRRSEQTREQIAAVAADLIGQVGYQSASLLEVARRAGVTKPTVYYHFDSKEDLYAAALSAIMRDFDRSIGEALDQAATPAEGIAAAVTAMFKSMSGESRRYHPLPEPGILSPEGAAQVYALRRQYEARLAGAIREGQAAGQVIDGHPTIMARILITSVGRVARWFDESKRMTAEEMVHLLHRMMLGGTLTSAGQARLEGESQTREQTASRAEDQSAVA